MSDVAAGEAATGFGLMASLLFRAFPLLFAMGLALMATAVLYFPAMEALRGTTAGKALYGLSVVRENGERIGWKEAILRRLPMLFQIFWIDAAFALFTKRRQRAFDMVAHTVVIRSAPVAATAVIVTVGILLLPMVLLYLVQA
jgi:uncharacterized RDD family membrane protein YckC